MKYSLILTLLLLASGCGPSHVEMPDEVRVYYNDYFQVIPTYKETSGSILIVDNLPDETMGRCDTPFLGGWTILLNKKHWDILWDSAKKVLVYHELTHCIFRSSAHSPDMYSYMYAGANLNVTNAALTKQVLDYTDGL